MAVTSYSHIAKGERQCVNSGVDVSEKLLFVVFVHLLEVHPCRGRDGVGMSQAQTDKTSTPRRLKTWSAGANGMPVFKAMRFML